MLDDTGPRRVTISEEYHCLPGTGKQIRPTRIPVRYGQLGLSGTVVDEIWSWSWAVHAMIPKNHIEERPGCETLQ